MISLDVANDILVNGDGVLAFHLDGNEVHGDNASILFKRLVKTSVIIVIERGSADIEIDYHMRHANSKDGNLVVLGNFSVIGDVTVSEDFSVNVLVLSKKFLSKVMMEEKPSRPSLSFPITNIIAMRDCPVLHIEPEEKDYVLQYFGKVVRNVGRNDAPLRLQLLYVSVIEYMMELINIILPRYIGIGTHKDTDRKRYIVDEFSKLVFDNFKSEHSVAWYADKLCISSQYLSKATRSVLGVSAMRVINDMITTEALIMLRKPHMSMQQISAELGFSDQSSFGKFFKKSHGMSPLTYRKQL